MGLFDRCGAAGFALRRTFMLPTLATARHRAQLRARVDGPILLMAGEPQLRNIPINHLPFRAESSFLYTTGCSLPGAALLMDDDGDTLFLPQPPDDDALWHGPRPTIAEEGAALGFAKTAPLSTLSSRALAHGARLHTLASTDPATSARLAAWTGRPHDLGENKGDPALISALIELRSSLDADEVAEMRAAAVVTNRAHRAAMAATRAGATEAGIGALFDGVISAHGMTTAYDSIVTVRGEVLHNHHRVNTLQNGQLVLLDGGAEAPSGYATDVTRAWPVSGRFDARQKAAYEAVLEAELHGISMVTAGRRYRDIHLAASRVIAQFLVDERILSGSVDGLVERGAHALFFPHGVGHLIGLDVHDLELYGDLAGYGPGRSRSTQFGLAFLRLDRDLQIGNVVTIEPGFYVVPDILRNPALTDSFSDCFDADVAAKWLGFGGIRIEDDVLVTPNGPEVLTAVIPKTIADVEAAMAEAVTPFW